jgi:hypothetical protein
MKEENLHQLIMVLNRAPGMWWLIGDSLQHWVTHRELKEPVCIGVTCSEESFQAHISHLQDRYYGLSMGSEALLKEIRGIRCWVEFNAPITTITVAPESDRERLKRRKDMTGFGLWRRHINPVQPYMVQLPFKYGELLDSFIPLWWVDQEHNLKDIPPNKPIWFTPERTKNAHELIRLMYECADRAGMRDALFISFGTLLGYVKFGDVIPYDNDLDMCIMSDRTTPGKIRQFIEEMRKPFEINGQKFPHGLTESMFRFSNNRSDLDYPVWLSVGHRSINNDNGVKSCIWMMFEHSNYYWHSKGDRWVTNAKFPNFQLKNSDVALGLGQPKWTLDEFVEIDFHGIKVNAPKRAGACLDWWYDGFSYFGEGSSAHKRILAIEDWDNRALWRMG